MVHYAPIALLIIFGSQQVLTWREREMRLAKYEMRGEKNVDA